MKLAILGATGRVGLHLVEQALEEDHSVTAIVRTPAKMTIQHDNLKVVEGDLMSSASLQEHFEGCDAVLSCIGTGTVWDVTVYSQSIKHITAAMKQANVKRLVAITSWGTFSDPNDRGPFLIEWFLRPFVLRYVLADMAVMEMYLKEEAQEIDFTTVRPPGIKDGPKTDEELFHEENRNFVGGAQTMMLRADVARFMLRCLKTEEFNRKWVAIGVKS